MIDRITCEQRGAKIRDDFGQTNQTERQLTTGDLIDLPADHHAGDLVAQYHGQAIGE